MAGRALARQLRPLRDFCNFINDLEGDPMSVLVDLITSGNAYVNVHTNDGISPTNTGPGDFPVGELRSQVEHRGH